jgi:hypothetical protein
LVHNARGVEFLSFGGSAGTHYLGPEVPVQLTGAGERTVEAWIYNPTPQDDEVIFAWGRHGGQQPEGKGFAVGHGLNNLWGALVTWQTGPDIGWQDQQVYGRWNYIVVTYDGSTTRAYSDGRLVDSDVGALDTAAFATDGTNRLHFRIARHNTETGDAYGISPVAAGSFVLAKLRVHAVVFDGATIKVRFESEKSQFASPLQFQGMQVHTPSGAVALTWTASPGLAVSIETSTNLINWSLVASNQFGVTYTNLPPSPVPGTMFFRLRAP